MDSNAMAPLDPPRFENGRPLLIAGLGERYTAMTRSAIPAQWERFSAHLGKVPGQIGRTAYGVSLALLDDRAHGFEYLTGVEVRDLSSLSGEWSRVSIRALRYAVFRHREHASRLSITADTIFSKWLPGSGMATVPPSADVPTLLERYGEGFDPKTGMGDIEVWVPIQA
jgi:AraC family transcriptional regulator